MKNYSFYIAGGDMRSVYLANALAAGKHKVSILAPEGADNLSGKVVLAGLEGIPAAEVVVLPLPCCDREGYLRAQFIKERVLISDVVDAMLPGSVLIGGLIPEAVLKQAEERSIPVYDYYRREEFAVRNAALTAEAAVALAMEMLTESISMMPVLVLGHGRIGRLLGAILKALDADVTVAARRFSDLAWIRSEGNTAVEFSRLNEEIGRFGVIFNTVPAMVLGREQLMLMNKNAIVIDLASEPCGTDFEAAAELGICARKALGLPGKFAPKTAGEIMKDTVLNILSEREERDNG